MQDIVFYLIKIDLKFLSLKKRFGNKGISGTVCNILIISNLSRNFPLKLLIFLIIL